MPWILWVKSCIHKCIQVIEPNTLLDIIAVKWSEVKVTQSCPTLQPLDYTVHGILQARTLEWVAFPFSRESSQPRNWTGISCIAGGFFTNWAIRETKILTLIVCFLLLLKREIKNVWYLQPISSIWRPLAFLPVTLSFSPFLLEELCCLGKGASFSLCNCFRIDKAHCP